MTSKFTTYTLSRGTTATVTVHLAGANVSGWTIEHAVYERAGAGSGLIRKSVASGFNNVSGANVTDADCGKTILSFTPADTSGLNYGAYYFETRRLDSGYETELNHGYANVVP